MLERPDGSYSPLSDSWSGSSLRNLFQDPADAADPGVQERLQENANTMSKMQELRTRMDNLNLKKQQSVSGRRAARPPSARKRFEKHASQTSLNLPPIKRTESIVAADWSGTGDPAPLQTNSALQQSNRIYRRQTKRDSLPTVRPPKHIIELSDNPGAGSGRADRSSRTPGPRQYSNYQPRLPSNNKKLISLDAAELKNDRNSFSPTQLGNSGLGRRAKRHEKSSSANDNDIFSRKPANESVNIPPFLSSSLNASQSRKSTSQMENSLSNSHSSIKLESSNPAMHPTESRVVPYLQLGESPAAAPPDSAGRAAGRLAALERRLVTSRRGRLSRPVVSPGRSTTGPPTILASPKGHSSENPRSARLRPSFPTRPLSGGPRAGRGRRAGPARNRCAGLDCRRKLNITNSFSCRCAGQFCALHRHPESHSCSYDYKTEGRKLLEQNNPLVTLPKLPKI